MTLMLGTTFVSSLFALAAGLVDLRTSKSSHEARQDGEEVRVPPSLWAMVNKAVEDLKVTDEEAAEIEVFMTTEKDARGWGSTTLVGVQSLLGLSTDLEADEALSDEAKLFIIASFPVLAL